MDSLSSRSVGTSRSPSSVDTLTTANTATETSSLSTEVFQYFYSKLVENLPMDDPNFTAKLYSARLLPNNLKEYVGLTSATRTEKATGFLDQVIKPSMTSFTELLSVMEDSSEYRHVNELAEQIKARASNPDPALTKQKKSSDNVNDICNPVTQFDKCKDDMKQCYRKRIHQKRSTKWSSNLGDPTLYIDVTIVKAKSLLEKYREQHAMSITESQHPYVTVEELLKNEHGNVILVEGDPGSGKTTFTFQICQEWAEGKLLVEDILFWIPLRHYNKSVNTIRELFDELGFPEMMDYAKHNSGKNLVLILDGWDELPNNLQTESLFRDIIFSKIRILIHSTILVTSRPTCSSEIAKAVEGTQSYYQILGFDKERANSYIKAYFHNDLSSSELLLTFLKNNQYLYQHFYMPISVVIMCFVYHSDYKQIPQTLSKLYERFVLLCLRSNVPHECNQDLPKFKTLQDIPEGMKFPFHNLCKMAYIMLKDNKLVLNEQELIVMQVDSIHDQLKQFDGFGLLHVDYYITKLATMETSYSFIHRSVQELLAAIHISNTGNIIDIIDEHFYEKSYLLNMFPFLFSLASKTPRRPLARQLLYKLFGSKKYANGDYIHLALFCLFEAHDDALCQEFGLGLSKNLTLVTSDILTWHHFLYFISVCGIRKLNINLHIGIGEPVFQIMFKYFCNSLANIASLQLHYSTYYVRYHTLSRTSMEQFAKAISTQHSIVSLYLHSICVPGTVSILCNSLSVHNHQISNLEFDAVEMNKDDLEAVALLFTACPSLESLQMKTSFEKGCLDSSSNFYKRICETKSLRKLALRCDTLSQIDLEVFGDAISQNCSLKWLTLIFKDYPRTCLDPVFNGLESHTSIARFDAALNFSERVVSNMSYKNIFALNRSLNFVKFEPVCLSSIAVSSICTALCANTTLVALEICIYVDAETCHAICDMLQQNTSLCYFFLSPNGLQKQTALAILNACRDNNTLKVLGKRDSNEDLYDHDIKQVMLEVQRLREEKNISPLKVYWFGAHIYEERMSIDKLWNRYCNNSYVVV